MSGARLTRRRALVAGALAGAGATLRGPSLGWAAERRVRSFAMDLAPGAFADGRQTSVLRAPRRFDLLGVRGDGVARAGLEVRVRLAGGRFGAWLPLGTGHAPDAGRAVAATDPVWTGASHELQLRARGPVGHGLRLQFVSTPPRRRSAGGAAGARARAARAGAAQAPGAPPTIIPRADWGAAAVPPRAASEHGEVQLAFVHHTVTANDYGPEDSADIVLAIAKYHRDSNGWNDIGYNFLVDKYGQVFEGRAGGIDQAVVGAQAQGWNVFSTGVATLGTFQTGKLPEPGLAAVAQLIAWKLTLHGAPVEGEVTLTSRGGEDNRYRAGTRVTLQRISGHRDGCATECPGAALYGQLDAVRARAASRAGAYAAAPALSLDAAAPAVAYGQDAVLGGTLSLPDGTPVAGAQVTLGKEAGSAFVTVARPVTDAAGAWSARVPWRRAGTLRAEAVVPGGHDRVRSPLVSVGLMPLFAVTSPGPSSRVVAGRRVVVRGTVQPAGSVRVRVERRGPGTTWVPVATVRRQPSAGTFAVPVRLVAPGLYRLTAQTGPASGPALAPPLMVRAVRRAS